MRPIAHSQIQQLSLENFNYFKPCVCEWLGVGPVFKGLKQFDTAALDFDFQSFYSSYDFLQAPSHCIYFFLQPLFFQLQLWRGCLPP